MARIPGGLGGMTRSPGSFAWHAVGLEWTLARWNLEALGRGPELAKGVLIATLAFLEAHQSGRRSAA